MAQNSVILGKHGDIFQYINCDADGKLNVNLDMETIDISGSIAVSNQITNYATEATSVTIAQGNAIIGTNMTQLNDKIILDGNYLQANIKNLPSVYNVAGSVTVNTISGFATGHFICG